MNNVPPPGWYPDPVDASVARYWDGGRWTEQTRPTPVASPPPTSLGAVPSAQSDGGKVPLFGARKHARETMGQLEAERFEIARLRAEMNRLGLLEIADLERRREDLRAEVATMEADLNGRRSVLETKIESLQARGS